MASSRVSKKGKRKDERPARARYWLKRTLEKRKVRNLEKHCGMSYANALLRWHDDRKGRIQKGFIRKG